MKKKESKVVKDTQIVWVYQDMDHGDIEVFSTKEAAKKHAEACWPDDEEGWDEGDSRERLHLGEYVTIFKKKLFT